MRGLFASIFATALFFTPSESQAGTVKLTEWEGKASLLSFPGANLEQFRLRAVTEWPADLPRVNNRYRVRLDGPGGKSISHQWSDNDAASGRWTTAFIPVEWVRDRLPENVSINLTLIDGQTGAAVSNTIKAGIDQFPRPYASSIVPDSGPFGWGEPLRRQVGTPLPMPRPTADGYRFVLLPGNPAILVSTTETSIAQFKRLRSDYDPAKGRSDEFELEKPDQPAVGITPAASVGYLKQLSASDRGITYRLPTREEWSAAARAGTTTRFWWGDAPTFPAGANFAGDEPGLKGDSTAKADGAGFKANEFGLLHAFGNVEEWVSLKDGGYVRIGGHFRSEIEGEVPEARVAKADEIGADPYVGLRPFADFSPDKIKAEADRLLGEDPKLSGVRAEFDPDRLTVVLTGRVEQPADRRAADAAIGPLWIVAAVENRIESPRFEPGRLAEIGAQEGETVSLTILGRGFERLTFNVRWAEPLPASGSSWWVNVLTSTGVAESHRMFEEPSIGGKLLVQLDRTKVRASDPTARIAISLGAAASGPNDPRIVSNSVPLNSR